MFQSDTANASGGKPLVARFTAPANPPKMNFGIAEKALREAVGQTGDRGELSIRGASARGNVVEVMGLVKGTTAEDVEVRLS